MIMDLDRLAALEAEATPGRWFFTGYTAIDSTTMIARQAEAEIDVPETAPCDERRCDWCAEKGECPIGATVPRVATVPAASGDTPTKRGAADGELIAEARNALPELISASRRAVILEAENERLRILLGKLLGGTPGVAQIAAERHRQQHHEGWTPEHDDEHRSAELSSAAIQYVEAARSQIVGFDPYVPLSRWPWDAEWWKPSDDPVRNLVKAGALIAAEIDRLQRAATGWSAHTERRDDG